MSARRPAGPPCAEWRYRRDPLSPTGDIDRTPSRRSRISVGGAVADRSPTRTETASRDRSPRAQELVFLDMGACGFATLAGRDAGRRPALRCRARFGPADIGRTFPREEHVALADSTPPAGLRPACRPEASCCEKQPGELAERLDGAAGWERRPLVGTRRATAQRTARRRPAGWFSLSRCNPAERTLPDLCRPRRRAARRPRAFGALCRPEVGVPSRYAMGRVRFCLRQAASCTAARHRHEGERAGWPSSRTRSRERVPAAGDRRKSRRRRGRKRGLADVFRSAPGRCRMLCCCDRVGRGDVDARGGRAFGPARRR